VTRGWGETQSFLANVLEEGIAARSLLWDQLDRRQIKVDAAPRIHLVLRGHRLALGTDGALQFVLVALQHEAHRVGVWCALCNSTPPRSVALTV
jgi:hypothetical protein